MEIPLKFYEDLSAFKLYLLDCGLFGCMADAPASQMLVGNNIFTIFEMLQEAIIKGIEVILFIKNNSDKDDFLRKLGFKIIVKEALSIHAVNY